MGHNQFQRILRFMILNNYDMSRSECCTRRVYRACTFFRQFCLSRKASENTPASVGLQGGPLFQNEAQRAQGQQRCCIVHVRTSNNEKGGSATTFINVLNLKFQTIVRLTTGYLGGQSKIFQRPQRRRAIARLLVDRIGSIIGGHYDYIKVVTKTQGDVTSLYLKEFLKRH